MAMSVGLLCLLVAMPASIEAANERTIALYSVNTKESLKVTYKRNGRYVPAAMKQVNWLLRDWRRNKPTRMDPKLIDLVWEIHKELGSHVPVHVISGYRSPATNNMLRRTRGGQARRSQHMLGKAMDVRFPDVPVRRLRYSALLREQGGVGYYPTSAMPFVHIDTGRVRHWPRMGRQELALLFPHGRTRHRPRRGGAVSRSDAIVARSRNPVLARRVAAFHVARRSGTLSRRPVTRVAAAAPRSRAKLPPPRLLQGPRLTRDGGQRPPSAIRYYKPTTAQKRPQQRQRVAALHPAPLPFRPAARANGWQATTRAPARKPAPQIMPRPKRPVAALPAQPLSKPVSKQRPLPLKAPGPARKSEAHETALPTPPERATPSQTASLGDGRGALGRLASMIFGAPKPSLRKAVKRTVSEPNESDWVSAPAYDEEHPEELFFRPFPIAPYITLTASADDDALTRMHAPRTARTLMLLVDHGTADPLSIWRDKPLTASLQSFVKERGGRAADDPPPREPQQRARNDRAKNAPRSRMREFASAGEAAPATGR